MPLARSGTPSGVRIFVRCTALVVLVFAAPIRPADAEVELARSGRLDVTIMVEEPTWCREQPAFYVKAATVATFANPAFAAAIERFGSAVVGPACAEAKMAALTGRVDGQVVWHGVAQAGQGWSLQASTTPAAPLDLDAGPAVPQLPPAPAPTAAPVSLPVAAPLDAGDQTAVEGALAGNAGRAVPSRHCWTAVLRDQNGTTQACLRVRGAVSVGAGADRRAYLLLAGDNTTDECHACSGLSFMAVLAQAPPGWRIIASSGAKHSGSFGKATRAQDFTIRRLGRDRWGWMEYGSYLAQGDLESGTTMWGLRGNAVVSKGELPGDHGNCAAGPDGLHLPSGEECVDVHILLHVDDSDLARPAYPISLAATGTRGGKPFPARTVTATYSEEKGSYVVPPGLP